MKTIKTISFLFFFSILAISFSCSDESDDNDLTYDMFAASLERNMDYNQLVNLFGEPNRDEGSGIHIYIWVLEDDTEVSVGFAGGYILYAYHSDKDGNILNTILAYSE